MVARYGTFEWKTGGLCLGIESGGSETVSQSSLGRQTSRLAYQYEAGEGELSFSNQTDRRDAGGRRSLA